MGPGIIEVFIEYWPMFLKGALGTLRYAAIAVAGGSILGALIAILRLSGNKIFDGIATIYVDVLRGTPLLVQMYIAYFFLPLVFPALNKVDKEVTVLIALTLNSSAYVSEIIRGGINSVDIGQTEAARSLGLSAKNTMIKREAVVTNPETGETGDQEYSAFFGQRIYFNDQGDFDGRNLHVV